MHANQRSITVTLHWQLNGTNHQSTIVCDDSPPRTLIPILATACGLPEAQYRLRAGAANRPALRKDISISAQGINDGSQLWLTDADPPQPTQLRCLIELSNHAVFFAPPAGISLTRAWLLRVLELLDPPAYRREITQLEQRNSPYRFVSNQEHCALRADQSGGWIVTSSRSDLITRLNHQPLAANRPTLLPEHAMLQLGEQGPELQLHLVPFVRI
ncbi:MAG: FHA domain-containing protein [Oscillochloris sp.]|nr:FHA domain-containing protein [Oscillochloris sp.]